jgi:hypothetical protein
VVERCRHFVQVSGRAEPVQAAGVSLVARAFAARRVERAQPRAEAGGRCPGQQSTTALRPERPRQPGRIRAAPRPKNLWRPFRPHWFCRLSLSPFFLFILSPRASAFGLSPGLGSRDPSGRKDRSRLHARWKLAAPTLQHRNGSLSVWGTRLTWDCKRTLSFTSEDAQANPEPNRRS